ncbi:MAG: DinB family protein [Pyrinomonadaceae bacterium]|nr:DinB family protein [Pyrinomonadaceae bacterium]
MKLSEINAQVEASHERFAKSFAGLTEEQSEIVGVTEHWSTKNTISHLTFWLENGAGFVTGLLDGTWKPRRYSMEEVHELNERNREDTQHQNLTQTCSEFENASAKVKSIINDLPEDEIDENSPLGKLIARMAIAHPIHHAAQIEDFRSKLIQ